MPDLAHWSIFLGATIVLLLIPGPSVLYVVTRALEAGYRGALFSALGLALGDLLQVVCVVVGLSALVASSFLTFAILKYLGSAYLILLGVLRLRQRVYLSVASSSRTGHKLRSVTSRRITVQAFFALNPKTGLFFLAFFPQFVSYDGGSPRFQILLFGVTFVVLGFLTNSAFGCIGGKLRSFAQMNSRFQGVIGYVSGVMLLALGVVAALAPLSIEAHVPVK